jgi:hypothetical protein
MTGGTGGSCVPATTRCGLISGNGGSITLQAGASGGGGGRPGNIILAPTGGRVGIGTTSPLNDLEVVAGGTTLADHWTTRSSLRWKTNIHTLEGALNKLERLRAVSYDLKTNGQHEIGVIAEEVGQVLPEVVGYGPSRDEAQGVDYGRLAALLIEAVKEQQVEIAKLKAQVRKLNLQFGVRP